VVKWFRFVATRSGRRFACARQGIGENRGSRIERSGKPDEAGRKTANAALKAQSIGDGKFFPWGQIEASFGSCWMYFCVNGEISGWLKEKAQEAFHGIW
jgi:hypothetical protein